MNGLLEFVTDVTLAAAVTTASHFGIAIEGGVPRTPPAAEARAVRRTAVASPTAAPAPRQVRGPAR